MSEAPGWSLQAVYDLESCPQPGHWSATGADPQFLITPPDVLSAGWYEIQFVIRVISGAARKPVLYMDHGAGFFEEGQALLAQGDVDGAVSALVRLDEPVVRFRLDPSEQIVEFELSELRVRALLPSEAAWRLLNGEHRRWGGSSPVRFGRFLHELREIKDAKGDGALVDWMRGGQSREEESIRYLRWISNAEAHLPSAAEGGGGLSVVLLPNPDVRDTLDAYAGVAAQIGEDDEVLVPAELSAYLAHPLPSRTRLVEQSDAVFYGLEQARKPFITWLGPGERMHQHAIPVLRLALNGRPDVRLVYTDEDFVDRFGERCSPYFKPDWDPEMLLAQDYPARSVVLERSFAKSLAGHVSGEAWLYGACLEASEELNRNEVLHLPVVTRHHLHAHGPFYAPLHGDAFVLQEPMRAELSRWRERRHPEARIECSALSGLARVAWPVPANTRVDIVIPTRDRVDLLATCVDSILALTDFPDYTVIILDNGSQEEASLAYLEKVAENPRVRVTRHDVPFNYSAINNYAVAQGNGDIVVLLNNDIEVIDGGWLAELAGQASRPGTGAVGAKLLYPDRTLQHAGVLLGVGATPGGVAAHAHAHLPVSAPGYFGRAMLVQTMSAVTAACLAVKRTVFEAVGGLDESLAVAFNDVDFCLRVRDAGFSNVWTPHALLLHHESASRGYEDTPEKHARFVAEIESMIARWGTALENDPAYSPNLALSPKEFTIDPDRFARM